jgi:CPA2 family monovalent cation:H+ antiporter-2
MDQTHRTLQRQRPIDQIGEQLAIVLRAYLLQIAIHSIIIVAAILLSSTYLLPLVSGNRFGHVLGALITLVAISPFLWALSLRRVAIEQVIILMQQRKYRGPIL